jgi:lysophospholipase L1-like esterase
MVRRHTRGSRGLGGRVADIATALVTVILLLLAAELALRFVLLRNLNPFEPDDRRGYRLKADFDGYYPRVAVRTDERGLRIPDEGAETEGVADLRSSASARGARPVVFIGDSVTFGFSVRAEESFVWLWSQATGRPVANAAVPGYNLGQAVSTLAALLEHGGPVPSHVVYGLCLNDILGASSPVSYADINPHANRSDDGGIWSRSLFVAFLERRVRRATDRWLPDSQPGETRPRDRSDLLRDLGLPEHRAAIDAFARQWRRLERIAADAGVPVTALVLPFREQLEEHPDWRAPQRFVSGLCAESGVSCLDPWDALWADRGVGLFTPGSSMHFSIEGHRRIARWLLDELDIAEPSPVSEARAGTGLR